MALGLAGAALFAAPQAGAVPSTRFSRDMVLQAARTLAENPYQDPAQAPRPLADLDYDRYRTVKFRSDRAVWGPSPTRFAIELFAPGFLYKDLVTIDVVENGRTRTLTPDASIFETESEAIAQALLQAGSFAGLRLLYPLNEGPYRNEFLVFQGASYFRAVSSGQIYGLSARGLALNVAQPQGEEFPLFKRFWIERPDAASNAVVVHALLDSPSVTGAYRFAVYPGSNTTLDVDLTLFPRQDLSHVGIGPLTSMYWFGAFDRPSKPDFRPAVHDSQGLAMMTGSGEWLWRPLMNPRTLQVSAFMDTDPQGFGLIQRSRNFGDYQDLEAEYHRRPSAWVRPRGPWGKGHVELVEIPTPSEVHDNIVAYWRPADVLRAGAAHNFSYRLTWPDRTPVPEAIGRVVYGAPGTRLGDGRPQIVLDYDVPVDPARVEVEASVSQGKILETIVQKNHYMDGIRINVGFDPQGADLVELSVKPKRGGRTIGETCLHRWLAR